jgi:hypothetical protein
MSCNCNDTKTEQAFSCLCDSFEHPAPLKIGAGLTDLPRQIASFAEFRRAMLFDLRTKAPLDAWKAVKPDDLGLMLLEMWAYICDSLSFYDKVISQEEYLRTAMRRPSLRRLVALLGYLPRPAVGSSVYLAATAEGREKITLPAGTAFRSGAFDGNPPQVFELETNYTIHPITNKWTILPPHRGATQTANEINFLVLPTKGIVAGKPVLLLNSVNEALTEAGYISQSDAYTGSNRKLYRKVRLVQPTQLPLHTPFAQLQFLTATYTTGLWTMTIGSTAASIATDHTSTTIVLNSQQHSISKGQYILVTRNTEARWFKVLSVAEVTRLQSAGDAVVLNENTFHLPGVSIPVTKIKLDTFINDPARKKGGADWTNDHREELTVHFGLQPAGTVTDEPKTTLAPDDTLAFEEKAERPWDDFDPQQFALTDKNNQGAIVKGHVDFDVSQLPLNQGEQWAPELTLPVTAWGNLIKASRGETVPLEILGSGNASDVNQAFLLKKKPLTYLPSPSAGNALGLQNTLRVYVNDILWKEAPSFFNRKPDEAIYIVRQNDEGDSLVIFGDGIRGRRLPSGTDNVTATYRFGAEAAAPPAGQVNQIAKPVKGLRNVNNPLAAGGGDDAEDSEGIRCYAPQSVLTLGRAVSIPDMIAITAAVPGVRVVQAQWRWHPERQSPVALIWFIGDADTTTIVERLHSVTDAVTPIEVERAGTVATTLQLDITIDPRYGTTKVINGVKDVLAAPGEGLLTPEQLGIGQPVFQSKLFSAALSVEGVLAVRNILWNGNPFSGFAQSPGAGNYFDFGDTGIQINGVS